MKATKLPSGSWRCRVRKKINGQTVDKSFTADTKGEAEYLAQEWLHGKKEPNRMTFKDALEEYIDNRYNVLSPSTIKGYRAFQKHAFSEIDNMEIQYITDEVVQRFINHNALHYSVKSLKNQLGLISPVLKRTVKVKLPQEEPYDCLIPTEDEVREILKAIQGKTYECMVLFALMLGMRQSEIAALKWENIDGQYISVKGAKVTDEFHNYIYKKANKSRASTRKVFIPDYLYEKLMKLDRTDEWIFHQTPDALNSAWRKLRKKHGWRKFTIHGLRHYNASVMLLQGIPDKYAMEILGQSTQGVLKGVYQGTYEKEKDEMQRRMNDYFNSL